MTATTAIAKKDEVQKHRGLVASLAEKFEMEPGMFLATIKSTVMPSSATNEEVCAFLMVSKEYGLNPLLREIHAFPKKGGGIQTVVGVDGWCKIITNHKDFDGAEFKYEFDEVGKPFATECTLYRKNCSHPVKVTEYYDECKRETQPWKEMPKRMLRHKALMQCGRIAFGISGIIDEDEARDIKEVSASVVPAGESLLTPGTHKRGRPKKNVEATAATNAPEGEAPAEALSQPEQTPPPVQDSIPPPQGAADREPGADDGEQAEIPLPGAKPELPAALTKLAKIYETHATLVDAELKTFAIGPFKNMDLEKIAAKPELMATISRVVARLANKMSK